MHIIRNFIQYIHGAKFIFFIVAGICLAASPLFAHDSCVECHKDVKFRILNKKLFDYYNYWKESTHDIGGVKCTDCHGGSPKKDDKDAAHKKNFLAFRVGENESFKKIPIICGRCHKEELKHFLTSKHYKALREKGAGPHCVTCHGSMNVGIYKASVIGETCSVCHNKEAKNLPEVGITAEKILHNINISRAYRNWVTLYFSEKQPETVKEINTLYDDIIVSWHTFNFEQIDKKSQKLLIDLKALVKKEIAEKKKRLLKK
jgi:hypothetical protein